MLKQLFFLVALLILMVQPAQQAQGAQPVDGKWTFTFDGDLKRAPKTVKWMNLDLKIEGATVSGTITVGSWPGLAPIKDGKLENGHITFTATGTKGSTTGIPTCAFDITLDGETMRASFKVIQNPGGPLGAGREYRYVGTRAESNDLSASVPR